MEAFRSFDVAVIGAGHAGVEAAIASAKRGCKTALFTISLDQIANMPCNPSIGGSAKGHLVREIDALGGIMGAAGDACCLQMRMLNRGKGASVHSPRAQADRAAYHIFVKKMCEDTPNLEIVQAEIADILIDENHCVTGVINAFGAVYGCRAAVLCTGTFLNGRIYIGRCSLESGPDACLPARFLSQKLMEMGVQLRRFKTGTPCRIHRRSVDFTQLEPQYGDVEPRPFSFVNEGGTVRNDIPCYIAYSTPETHRIIRENLGESPLYSKMISGVGPRYCPSIEDKVVRFAERDRHQIFIEPTGVDTDEMYLGGFSTSLPEFVQIQMLRSVKGLENAEIMRSAYAIEYDCINPRCLDHTLAFKAFRGLYAAGQFNGTSGYEEAAAQGLVAGINASAFVLCDSHLELPRSSSYIGTLVDDLVTKGTDDPYRMMTARSEYRLSLRHSSADARLTPIGHDFGLISSARYNRFMKKMEHIADAVEIIRRTSVPANQAVNSYLSEIGTSPLNQPQKLYAIMKRPQVDFYEISKKIGLFLDLTQAEAEEVILRIKYEEYIDRQNQQAERLKRLEKYKLPQKYDYHAVRGLSSEAIEKLNCVSPSHLGQAARISGVSPADVSILMTWLKAGDTNETAD